jgi:hypothetical protein
MARTAEDLVGRALRDSSVRKRHPRRLSMPYGLYVWEDELLKSAAFWADSEPVDPEAIRSHIEAAGGQWARGWSGRPQYFLPALTYHRLRQRERER